MELYGYGGKGTLNRLNSQWNLVFGSQRECCIEHFLEALENLFFFILMMLGSLNVL